MTWLCFCASWNVCKAIHNGHHQRDETFVKGNGVNRSSPGEKNDLVLHINV